MTIADLRRQYEAAYPEGLWFKNGGRRWGKYFPSRTVYGGKYFIEGETGIQHFMVWGVVTKPRFRFEPVRSFHSIEDARNFARQLAKENA